MNQRAAPSTAPFGIAFGLLMFSFVSLSGIAGQVEPFVIAQRATVSALAVGIATRFAMHTVTELLHKRR